MRVLSSLRELRTGVSGLFARGGSGALADLAEADAAEAALRDLVEDLRRVGRDVDAEPLRELRDPGELVRARREHRPPLALQPSLQVDGGAVALQVARPGD